MSLSPAVIDAMVAAGCSVEQLAAAMKADLAEVEAREYRRREMATERKRRQRAKASPRHAMSRGQSVTDRPGQSGVGHAMSRGQSVTLDIDQDGSGHAMSRGQHGTLRDKRDPSSPEGFPPTPPFPKTPSSSPPSPPKGGSSPTDFEKFWEAYPLKVAQKSAKAAFTSARKRVDFETLMAGLARYAAKTDDRPWCNPATWLKGDRWSDSPAAVPVNSVPKREGEAIDWPGRLRTWNNEGLWPHSWGPKPGEPGCQARVPIDQDDPLRSVIERAGHKFIVGRMGKAWLPYAVVAEARDLAGAA